MEAGALGCSISGAGPTIFAWALEADAARVRDGMVQAFSASGVGSDAWVLDMQSHGARIEKAQP
jgi:homoserine kinase